MCVLSIASQVVPGCPLLIWQNRDESYSRSTALPKVFSSGIHDVPCLGGIDLEHGGTWLGINPYGLVIAVTNRHHGVTLGGVRSRGLLCRDLLGCATVAEAEVEIGRQWEEYDYDGCNLVVLSREQAVLVEAVDGPKITHLPAGVHTLTNGAPGDINDARLRIVHGAADDLRAQQAETAQWIEQGRAILSSRGDGNRTAVCVSDEKRGTVSSSIIALTTSLDEAEYYYAPGPPCRTPFNDYSKELRHLLR